MVFLHFLFCHKFEKIWKFVYLVFLLIVNFRKFVLAKSFAGIYYSELTQYSQNLRKLPPTIITQQKLLFLSTNLPYLDEKNFHRMTIIENLQTHRCASEKKIDYFTPE